MKALQGETADFQVHLWQSRQNDPRGFL